MKKLGFGMMRLPLKDAANPESIDQEQLNRMADAFLDQGFVYFDTAYRYHQGTSEHAFRKAVAERYPRERFVLADKMPSYLITAPADFQRIFDEQLEKCGVEYFDYYLLHTLGTKNYALMEEHGGFPFMEKVKAQGKAKHIGFSYHDKAELLDEILTRHPEMEFVQLQINYLDWEDESIQSRKCYEVARKHHKPVIVMEPVKGGALANVPAEAEALFRAQLPQMSPASWAVRYAASLEQTMMVLSGMSSWEQLADNTGYMADFVPLDPKEQALVQKAVEIIDRTAVIPCTSCQYCVEGCPKHIPIPRYFSLYNDQKRQGFLPSNRNYYTNLAMELGKASDCIACGQCESHCPQHIEIIEELERVARMFEA